MKIHSVRVLENAAGKGWFVMVKLEDGIERPVGGTLQDMPVFDPIIVQAEVARWTAKMLLGREYD